MDEPVQHLRAIEVACMVELTRTKALFHLVNSVVVVAYKIYEKSTTVQSTTSPERDSSRECNEGGLKALIGLSTYIYVFLQYRASREGWHKRDAKGNSHQIWKYSLYLNCLQPEKGVVS
jgi:hypothetical protein